MPDELMWLPEALTTRFWQTLQTYEEERKMPYITSVERLGIAKGRAEERLDIVLRLLTRRCGTLTPETIAQIEQLTMPQLEHLADALLDFTGMDDLHTWLQNLPAAE